MDELTRDFKKQITISPDIAHAQKLERRAIARAKEQEKNRIKAEAIRREQIWPLYIKLVEKLFAPVSVIHTLAHLATCAIPRPSTCTCRYGRTFSTNDNCNIHNHELFRRRHNYSGQIHDNTNYTESYLLNEWTQIANEALITWNICRRMMAVKSSLELFLNVYSLKVSEQITTYCYGVHSKDIFNNIPSYGSDITLNSYIVGIINAHTDTPIQIDLIDDVIWSIRHLYECLTTHEKVNESLCSFEILKKQYPDNSNHNYSICMRSKEELLSDIVELETLCSELKQLMYL